MTNVSPLPLNQMNHKALALLANGLAADFAEFVQSDDKVVEALQEAAERFVAEQVPFTNEEAQSELMFMLYEQLRLGTY